VGRPLSLPLRGCPSPAEGGGTLPFSGRGVGERGLRFAGYAAVFDTPDRGGDIVRKGAFAKALERSGEVPVLWQHRAGAVIGRVEHLSEDARGLRIIAAVDDARAARLLEAKKVDGLSFGYRVREAKSAGALRELIELDLVEVSLVAKPMQPKARVHAVETAE
jgi:HK97 family phage prohead protease